VDERCSDFQIWPPTVQKLETLEERPLVLPHNVASQRTCGSTLASNRVDEDRFSCLKSFFDKFKDGVRGFVFGVARVEEHLSQAKSNAPTQKILT